MSIEDLFGEAADMLNDPDRQDAREVVKEIVDGLLRENELVQEAFSAIVERSGSEDWAHDEVARVFLGIYWEVGKRTERVKKAGGPDALMQETFELLRDGARADDLFE